MLGFGGIDSENVLKELGNLPQTKISFLIWSRSIQFLFINSHMPIQFDFVACQGYFLTIDMERILLERGA